MSFKCRNQINPAALAVEGKERASCMGSYLAARAWEGEGGLGEGGWGWVRKGGVGWSRDNSRWGHTQLTEQWERGQMTEWHFSSLNFIAWRFFATYLFVLKRETRTGSILTSRKIHPEAGYQADTQRYPPSRERVLAPDRIFPNRGFSGQPSVSLKERVHLSLFANWMIPN